MLLHPLIALYFMVNLINRSFCFINLSRHRASVSKVVSGLSITPFSAVPSYNKRNWFSISLRPKLPTIRGFMLAGMTTSTLAPISEKKAVEIFRSSYRPSDYTVTDVFLRFNLNPESTLVSATSNVVRKATENTDLILDGENLRLISLKVDGVTLTDNQYRTTDNALIIYASALPKSPNFILETEVEIIPNKNLALSGLYSSGPMLCTQCEAMGFRRITYHLDRPDILSRYKVRLEGDITSFPILLSNGNLVSSGVSSTSDNKHWVVWEDPFPKPSYLFALVAGDLGYITEDYVTSKGLNVKLGIYSEKKNVNKLQHAMYSLKKSMEWDEQTFDLPYDLGIYNIVATDDFNMGAMENKGLNVFNSAYVLADPSSATDADYENILGVIGHEYFHNWTGNRVTVRDWFQLTLKEGLTVFRDQWFSSDMGSKAVKRIEDVRGLRGRQFAEDSGPMAHPIRPESYISMDNFYTGTVYVKGAEVVRMYRTLLGEEGFKKGMKLYFERHDGSAVTCDDFRAAMADANNVDLSQFERWYSQAGTPVLRATSTYDAAKRSLSLTLQQHTPSTPGQDEATKLPQIIPVSTGLLSAATGQELVPTTLLTLRSAEETFVFENVMEEPVVSLLRDFSAPVRVEYTQSDEELALLMAHDTDSFNRWDASIRLSTKLILTIAKLPLCEISSVTLPEYFSNALKTLLVSAEHSDPSLVAYALQLPDLNTLGQETPIIDIDRLHAARSKVKQLMGRELQEPLRVIYNKLSLQLQGDYQFTPRDVGLRRLRNTCLDLLSDPELIIRQLNPPTPACMTDKLAATSSLLSCETVSEEVRAVELQRFYNDANDDQLVLNKWFAIQASSNSPNQLDRVKQLKAHPDFKISNPNRARSVLSVFAGNLPHFHAADGSGYDFIADNVIEIDALNPQVAARLASSFSQWKRFDTPRQEKMCAALRRIQESPGLSKDTAEVVGRSLK